MSESLSKAEYEDWYDNGEGSENMKRRIARSAKENPVTPALCVTCDIKAENKRLREALESIFEMCDCVTSDIEKRVRNVAEQALKGQ